MSQPTPAHRWYVYAYIDTRLEKSGQVIYVGKGTHDGAGRLHRMESHWASSAHENKLFGRVLNKIRAAGLEPRRAVLSWHDVEAEAFAAEVATIAKYMLRRDGGTLCNLTYGGEGSTGLSHSLDSKQKIKVAVAALWESPQHIARVKAAWTPEKRAAAGAATAAAMEQRFGKKTPKPEMTPKRRAQLSAELMAAAQTPEALAKRSASMKAIWQDAGYVEKVQARRTADSATLSVTTKNGIAQMSGQTKARLSMLRSQRMKARHAARQSAQSPP